MPPKWSVMQRAFADICFKDFLCEAFIMLRESRGDYNAAVHHHRHHDTQLFNRKISFQEALKKKIMSISFQTTVDALFFLPERIPP